MNKLGPYDLNTIAVGDCLEVMRQMPDGCVDLVVTSPPYNVGVGYDKYKDRLTLKKYINWLCIVFEAAERTLIPGGHICIQIANTGGQPYQPKTDLLTCALAWGLSFRGEIIWDKQNITVQTAWGSWLSPNQPSIRDRHEYILVYRKPGKRSGKSDLAPEDFIEYTQSIWRIMPETNRLHPAPFPIELANRCIRLYSFIGEMVFDPFMGSGTTAVAADRLGRKFFGCDISEEYVKMSLDRIHQDRLRRSQLELPL